VQESKPATRLFHGSFRLLIALSARVGAFFLLVTGWVSIMHQEGQSGKLLSLAQRMNPLLLKVAGSPVLATYHIRTLNQAFKRTFPHLSQLADSAEEEYNRNAFICSSSKGVFYTVWILTFIKRLTSLCLQLLHHVNVITSWRSFVIILWRLSQLAFSKCKLLNQPAKLFAFPKEEKGNAGITPNNYQILPP
jgi:hypothetical protein